MKSPESARNRRNSDTHYEDVAFRSYRHRERSPQQWLRQAAPSLNAVAVAAVVGALAASAHLLMAPSAVLNVLYVLAFAYGGARIVGFSPIWRSGYLAWLLQTPWHRGQRLPLGSVHPGLQDLVLLSLIIGPAAMFLRTVPVSLLAAASCGYAVFVTFTVGKSGQKWEAMLLAFGLGVLILLWTTQEPLALVVIVLHGICYVALQRSLLRLQELSVSESGGSLAVRIDAAQRASSGWPFAALSPRLPPARINLPTSGAAAFVAGWLTFVFEEVGDGEYRLTVLLLIAAPIVRLGVYLSGHSGGGSILRRIGSFKPLLRSYDYVFFAPLIAVAIELGAPPLLARFTDFPSSLVNAIIVFAVVLILCAGGPTLAAWRFTSGASMTPPTRQQGRFVRA